MDCMPYPSVLSFTSAQKDGLVFHLFLVVMLGPAMGWRHGNKNKKGWGLGKDKQCSRALHRVQSNDLDVIDLSASFVAGIPVQFISVNMLVWISVWIEDCFVGMMRVASWTETGADNADENITTVLLYSVSDPDCFRTGVAGW